MGNYLLAAGLVCNAALMVINRYVKPLPDWMYLPGMVLGIVLVITGGLMLKRS